MTTLAANKARTYQGSGVLSEAAIPAVATDIIYEGAAVGMSSGTARPLQAGDTFAGFCQEKADNAAGSAGDIDVRVFTRGRIKLPVTGVTAITDRGSKVYATDDDTFTLTGPTGGSLIGVITEYVLGTTVIVEFDADNVLLNA